MLSVASSRSLCRSGASFSRAVSVASAPSLANGLEQLMAVGGVTDESCRFRSNRSRRGLYDGKDIRSGNNVSFSMKTTKRTFKPNVFLKRVYSETLDEMVRFHLTSSALRSIDKAGGLDNYLLTSKHVTEGEGLEAKKRVLKEKKRLAKQAMNAGVTTESAATATA